MLKKKPAKKLDYHSQLTKLVRFQNQASLQFEISWLNPAKSLCKSIKSTHYCFCGHFLSQHLCREQTINKCTADRCKCSTFCFVPDLNLKCICKHAPFRHNLGNKKCEQCVNCIGFLTDWLCECGYRYQQHITDVKVQKESDVCHKENNGSVTIGSSKKKQKEGNSSLPRLNHTVNVRYPSSDKVKEPITASLVRLKVANSNENQASGEGQHECYLKEKLKQANLRYFSKFKELRIGRQPNEDRKQQRHEVNGLDLYIQPHFFRNCSLTEHISILTASRR